MRSVSISLLLLILSLVTWISAAEPESRATDATDDETTVRSLDDQERVAVLKRDKAAMERLWSDELFVNAPNNQLLIGKAAVLAWVDRGIINFSSFERQVELVRVDGDIAIIMGAETVKPIGDAPMAGLRAGQAIQRRFTNIWKRTAGTWRLYARHANVVPAR
jgi:ketosteroid isomerase-like protein